MKNRKLISITFACLLAMLCILSGAKAEQPVQVKEAQKILDATGIKCGLIVHIGCGDGKLTAALHAPLEVRPAPPLGGAGPEAPAPPSAR